MPSGAHSYDGDKTVYFEDDSLLIERWDMGTLHVVFKRDGLSFCQRYPRRMPDHEVFAKANVDSLLPPSSDRSSDEADGVNEFDGFSEPDVESASAVSATGKELPPSAVGITLAGVKQLRDEVARHNRKHPSDPIETTSDVANKIVKPATAGHPKGRQAYAHLDGGKHRGEPVLFVSHTWQADGVALLETVVAHGEGVVASGAAAEPVYYLDVASVDQHATDQAAGNTAMPLETLRDWFVEQITSCAEVLVVAEPFDAPIIARRMWCLFEVAMATVHNVDISVLLPPSQEVRLRDRLCEEGGHEILVAVMTEIDCERAEATVAADLENIRRIIETDVEGGYGAINDVYKGVIRRWALAQLEKLLATYEDRSLDAARFAHICGLVLKDVGDYDKAFEFYEIAIKINVDLLGPEHSDVAAGYHESGAVHMLRGDYDKALECHHKAHGILLVNRGPKHPDVAISCSNIGAVHMLRGDYDKALEFHEKALKIRLDVLNAEHPDVADSNNNIGEVHKTRGDYDQALEFYERALEIRLDALGPRHPVVAISYNNIGIVHFLRGDCDEALEFLEKALQIDLDVLGPEHPSVATAYSGIGTVHDSQGDSDKALEFYKKALRIQLDVLGPKHLDVATSYNNIGMTYESRGEYDNALEFLESALQIKLAVLHPEHPGIATAYINIGTVHHFNSSGDKDKALEFYEKALRIKLDVLGPGHPDVAISYGKIGNVHFLRSDHDKALEFYEKALQIQLDVLGPGHPDTQTVVQFIDNTKAQM